MGSKVTQNFLHRIKRGGGRLVGHCISLNQERPGCVCLHSVYQAFIAHGFLTHVLLRYPYFTEEAAKAGTQRSFYSTAHHGTHHDEAS